MTRIEVALVRSLWKKLAGANLLFKCPTPRVLAELNRFGVEVGPSES